jgi:hypothetical protein
MSRQIFDYNLNNEFEYEYYRGIDTTYDVLVRISLLLTETEQTVLVFHLINEDGSKAFGEGASRSVYHEVFQDLIADKTFIIDGFFAKINLDSPTIKRLLEANFTLDTIGRVFALTICYANYVGYILPFHLDLSIYLLLTADLPIEESEIEFYAELFDPEAYQSAKKVKPEDFTDLCTGYETHMDYYGHLVFGTNKQTKHSNDFHLSMAREFLNQITNPDAMDYSMKQFDEIISGPYIITQEMIFNMFSYETECDINTVHMRTIWETFIKTLSESAIKKFLISIGSTLDLKHSYKIICKQCDGIKIRACFGSITIPHDLFSPETDFRTYFLPEVDIMRDQYGTARIDPQQSAFLIRREIETENIFWDVESIEIDPIDSEIEDTSRFHGYMQWITFCYNSDRRSNESIYIGQPIKTKPKLYSKIYKRFINKRQMRLQNVQTRPSKICNGYAIGSVFAI